MARMWNVEVLELDQESPHAPEKFLELNKVRAKVDFQTKVLIIYIKSVIIISSGLLLFHI